MFLKLLVLCAAVEIVKSKIRLDFNIDKNGVVTANYLGEEVINSIDYDDLKILNVTESDLKSAVETYTGNSPDGVSIKDPPSWANKCNIQGESLSIIISIESATVRDITKHPVRVAGLASQDYENTAKMPTTMNVGISNTVENKITTSWSHQKDTDLAFGVDVNFYVEASLTSNSNTSFVSDWLVSKEKTVQETIGTNTTFATVLQPGRKVTATLSVITAQLLIDVVYKVKVDGNVRAYFSTKYQEYNCWRYTVDSIFPLKDLSMIATVTETIKYGYNTEMSLEVVDKANVLP